MTSQVETYEQERAGVRGAFGTDWMAEQLPGVLAADPFLQRFLRIFQDVADTVRWPADHLEDYVSTSVAPLEFVRWLGRWLNLEIETTWDPERQREFVRTVGPMFRKRGTPAGLTHYLEAVTGGPVEVTDNGGVNTARTPMGRGAGPPTPHHPSVSIVVATPGSGPVLADGISAETDQERLDRLRGAIALLLPANTVFELHVDSARFEPDASQGGPL